MNPDGHGCEWSAGFRACVKNPWRRIVLLLVLVRVRDFSRVFEDEDEDENEEEARFECFPHRLFSPLCLCSVSGVPALKRTEVRAPLDGCSSIFIRVHPCASVVSILLP